MTASKLDTFPSVARGRAPHRARLCWVFAMSLLATAGCAGQDPPAAATDARPNILYIMSDDHAVQAVSAYGHPVSQIAPTPNIDRIGEQGLIFENAFVTNSLCGPSRAAILTGKYGHLNRFTRNGDIFDGSQWTWPRALKQAGYQTALIGKWHLDRTPVGLEFDYWKSNRSCC